MVGSGPSTAMGYPSWGALASAAVALCRTEGVGRDPSRAEKALNRQDFPGVFEEARAILGMPRLLQHLRGMLNPSPSVSSKIYELMARWPVPVYLTTNFDHELTAHLAKVGDTYLEYTNSEDHLTFLVPDTAGVVVGLHGDLRSDTGLILTSSQYREIAEGAAWAGWRTKLTSIFQMNRVVIVGHSLTDPHIQHVLEAAKRGSGVVQPVCWIAPDVDPLTVRKYLEEYRIRVITYDNADGTHRNLVRLVEHISDFVPPRIAVHINQNIERASRSALGESAAAPGFFVFNKLSAQTDFESKRLEVMLAAVRGALLSLADRPAFSIAETLHLAGWPATLPLPDDFREAVGKRAVEAGVLVATGDAFAIAPGAVEAAHQEKSRFEHLRSRFIQSLSQRLQAQFPGVTDANDVASHIEAALTGYFREGGLTLASTLSAGTAGLTPTVPTSVIRFINEASTRYADHLHRQAFSTVSLDAFVRAQPAEREYLGRVSQGFYGFHCLGVFGDAARERLRHVRETVWLVDSSAQIPAIALAAPANAAFRAAFDKLRALGVRLFSIERLFEETREHLWFADRVVRENGPSSPAVIASAKGIAPYRKANLFLEGFVGWQATGNPADWERYMYALSGTMGSVAEVARAAINAIGIEVFDFGHWPGFSDADFAEAAAVTEKIVQTYLRPSPGFERPDYYQKAQPEAEALLVVENERAGKYAMISPDVSPAWFLSETSILNAVREGGRRITWQPEAFVRFASTLSATSDQDEAERAFDVLLWSLAQSGVSVLDDRLVATVFGGVIDQARLTIAEQHLAYEAVLGEKYGESIERVLDRVPVVQQPLAALQLANERAAKESALRTHAEAVAGEAVKRAVSAEKELTSLDRSRRKRDEKRRKALQRSRRAKSKKKKRR